jgi:hypothetical protein
MKGDGAIATDNLSVGPNSRATVNPRNRLGTGNDAAHDFSAKVECTNGQKIIAERPMYFAFNGAWTGGHDVVGAAAPASDFFFAEGTCRPGFEPFLCIQNPGSKNADLTITYMKGDGTTSEQRIGVAGYSRVTITPKNLLGVYDDTAHDFSVHVACTNGQKIIAERPMYFNYKGSWTGGHDVIGVPGPSSTWYFAEGYTGQ